MLYMNVGVTHYSKRRKYMLVLPDKDVETNPLEINELSASVFKCGKCSYEDSGVIFEVYHNVIGPHRHLKCC
jgi:hypothetical protein